MHRNNNDYEFYNISTTKNPIFRRTYIYTMLYRNTIQHMYAISE